MTTCGEGTPDELEIHDRVTDFGVRISGPPPISRTVSRRSLIRLPCCERARFACACLVRDPRAMTLRSACSSAAWNAASRAAPVHQPSATLVGVYEAARSVWTEVGTRLTPVMWLPTHGYQHDQPS